MNNIKFAGKCEIFDVIPREDNYTRTLYVYMVMSFRGCKKEKKNSTIIFHSSFLFFFLILYYPAGAKVELKQS